MTPISVIERAFGNLAVWRPKRRRGGAFGHCGPVLGVVALLVAFPTAALASSQGATQTTVSLTFDDGIASAYLARAMLAAHGMHATFYLNSGHLEDPGFMTWQQVQDLYGDGNEIAGHTALHVNLPQIDAAEAQRQICDDRVALLRHGYAVTDFAYPYGSYDPSIVAMVRACGYNSARTTNQVPGSVEGIPPARPYAIGIGTSSLALSDMEATVTRATRTGGWVPLMFHGICDACSPLAISEADLTRFLDWLRAQSVHGVVVKTVQQVVGGSVRPAVQGPLAPFAPNGTNGLRNPSLEQSDKPDGSPGCWSLGGDGNNTATWTRTTTAHTGTFAERVDVTNFVDGENRLTVLEDLGSCSPSVVPGHRYLITGWYMSTVPVYFTAHIRDLTTFAYWTKSPPFLASSSWVEARWVTPVIPSNTDGLSFGLAIGSAGSLTVDDLGIDDAARGTPTVIPVLALSLVGLLLVIWLARRAMTRLRLPYGGAAKKQAERRVDQA
jgi:peptidoglycan/xylan/chitin deacetylase (PgdA/CDA1 family)